MTQKLRIFSLITIHVLILAHIYIFGDEVVGSVDFQEFFHSFIKYGIINSGVILVIIAFIVTLIFGRFFCGWGCHFGAVQELSWAILKKLGIRPKTINSSIITILPLFMLINFYILPNAIYAVNQPWEAITIEMANPDIWAFLPGFTIATLTFIIDGFLIVYFLGRKGFCRYICPWGAFLKIPNTLAMFKVRNSGGCIESGNCTSSCPVGIDVSYEINHYEKVTNTNCTSCMICTDGCPSKAITYQWKNPLKENFQFKHYFLNKDMYSLPIIKKKFRSIHSKDLIILILILFFGFSIDGLYGMGHFLSFGLASIVAIKFFALKSYFNNKIAIKSIRLLIVFIFCWHATIKYSIWQGLKNYDANNYNTSIKYLECAVRIYPKSIGRFHVLLGRMYLENNSIDKARNHALKAIQINPNYHSSNELLKEIESIEYQIYNELD